MRIARRKAGQDCATARNLGLASCHGKYIIFLDSDDWLDPFGIEVQVDYLESHDNLKQCGGYSRVSDGISHTFVKVSSMIRKECFNGLQFDSDLPFFDDVDMFLQIRDQPLGFIPITITNYFLNPSGLTQTTGHLYSEYIMWKILIKNRAWDHFPKQIRETTILFLNWITGTDLVKWKKEHINVI